MQIASLPPIRPRASYSQQGWGDYTISPGTASPSSCRSRSSLLISQRFWSSHSVQTPQPACKSHYLPVLVKTYIAAPGLPTHTLLYLYLFTLFPVPNSTPIPILTPPPERYRKIVVIKRITTLATQSRIRRLHDRADWWLYYFASYSPIPPPLGGNQRFRCLEALFGGVFIRWILGDVWGGSWWMRGIFKVGLGPHGGWTTRGLGLVLREPSFQAWWSVQRSVRHALFLLKTTISQALNKESNLKGKEAIILMYAKRCFVKSS